MTAEPVACRHCPAQLHVAVHERMDEWVWADEAGSMIGADPDLPPDPYGYLARLGEVQLAAHKLHKPGKSEFTWLFWRAVHEYSALKVRLDLGGTWHSHYPQGTPPSWHDGPLRWHCGWPGLLRPSGWYCRHCDEPLTEADVRA